MYRGKYLRKTSQLLDCNVYFPSEKSDFQLMCQAKSTSPYLHQALFWRVSNILFLVGLGCYRQIQQGKSCTSCWEENSYFPCVSFLDSLDNSVLCSVAQGAYAGCDEMKLHQIYKHPLKIQNLCLPWSPLNTAANYLMECVLLQKSTKERPKERLLTKTMGLIKWCEYLSKPEVLFKGRKDEVKVGK